MAIPLPIPCCISLHDLKTTSIIFSKQTSLYFRCVQLSLNNSIKIHSSLFVQLRRSRLRVLNILDILIRVKCMNFCLSDLFLYYKPPKTYWLNITLIYHFSQLCSVVELSELFVLLPQGCLGSLVGLHLAGLEYTRWQHLHVLCLHWGGWNKYDLVSLQQDNLTS